MRKGFRPERKHLLDDSVLDDATRKALMLDIQRGAIPPPRQTNGGTQTGANAVEQEPSRPEKSGEDLLGVMCQRLKTLEATNVMLHKELREKSIQVISLQDHLAEAKRLRDVAEHEKLVLAERVSSMNHFLADYGLTYVGDRTSPINDDNGAPHHKSTSPQSTPEVKPFNLYDGNFSLCQPGKEAACIPTNTNKALVLDSQPARPHFSVDRLIQNAELLSASIGTHEAATNSGFTQLQQRDAVAVCVYADGIVVNRGPFRPYGWPLCDAFIGDVLEGYFPYEYKDRYPNGFLMEIVDRRSEICPKEPDNLKKAGRYKSVRTLGSDDGGFRALTNEEFLSRLPQQRITPGGMIVDSRSAIAAMVNVEAPVRQRASSVNVETAAGKMLHDVEMAGKVTSIQVKFPKGQKIQLHMFRSDTVGELLLHTKQAALGAFDEADWPREFELCTVFPRRTYDDHSMTLEAAGLFPNCQLLVKVLQKEA